jgi:ribosome recycling factor
MQLVDELVGREPLAIPESVLPFDLENDARDIKIGARILTKAERELLVKIVKSVVEAGL